MSRIDFQRRTERPFGIGVVAGAYLNQPKLGPCLRVSRLQPERLIDLAPGSIQVVALPRDLREKVMRARRRLRYDRLRHEVRAAAPSNWPL